jgi:hypothetical protein
MDIQKLIEAQKMLDEAEVPENDRYLYDPETDTIFHFLDGKVTTLGK